MPDSGSAACRDCPFDWIDPSQKSAKRPRVYDHRVCQCKCSILLLAHEACSNHAADIELLTVKQKYRLKAAKVSSRVVSPSLC